MERSAVELQVAVDKLSVQEETHAELVEVAFPLAEGSTEDSSNSSTSSNNSSNSNNRYPVTAHTWTTYSHESTSSRPDTTRPTTTTMRAQTTGVGTTHGNPATEEEPVLDPTVRLKSLVIELRHRLCLAPRRRENRPKIYLAQPHHFR